MPVFVLGLALHTAVICHSALAAFLHFLARLLTEGTLSHLGLHACSFSLLHVLPLFSGSSVATSRFEAHSAISPNLGPGPGPREPGVRAVRVYKNSTTIKTHGPREPQVRAVRVYIRTPAARIKAHEAKMSWQTRFRNAHAEDNLLPNIRTVVTMLGRL